MKFKITPFIHIEKVEYGSLVDDFTSLNTYGLKLILLDIEKVLNNEIESINIYGNICYNIHFEKEKSKLFCYNELIGEEQSKEIYNLFKEYTALRIQLEEKYGQ